MSGRMRWPLRSIEAQMASVFALVLLALLGLLAMEEIVTHEGLVEAGRSERTVERLNAFMPLVASIPPEGLDRVIAITSTCHAGYSVTGTPFDRAVPDAETRQLAADLAARLDIDASRIRAGRARLGAGDFAYDRCTGQDDMSLPLHGLVIGARLADGRWLNLEVHPHEWHVREIAGWLLRVGGGFAAALAITVLLLRRINRPLNALTRAARDFAAGLKSRAVKPGGPDDLRDAIEAFNAMQDTVAGEVRRRTLALAAISHDLRTPLTSLRLRAEMIEDAALRNETIASIERLDAVVASALNVLRTDAGDEAVQLVDVAALIAAECEDFLALGRPVEAVLPEEGARLVCRPVALGRAVRNLVENALIHAGSARVELAVRPQRLEIRVSDTGPGIPEAERERVLQPFERLSAARDGAGGGIGLGLAVAVSVAQAHGGQLRLEGNRPRGLIAVLDLPRGPSATNSAP